jgi:hypothetical protein
VPTLFFIGSLIRSSDIIPRPHTGTLSKRRILSAFFSLQVQTLCSETKAGP